MIDQLAGVRFAGAAGDVGTLLSAWSAGGAGRAAAFAAACPGGVAPAGSAAEAVQACRTALADGTRGGLIVTFLFYVWASAHYFLAAIGMARHLRARGPDDRRR